MRHKHEPTDQKWERIKNTFPPKYPMKRKHGRPTKYYNHSIMNGILWISIKCGVVASTS